MGYLIFIAFMILAYIGNRYKIGFLSIIAGSTFLALVFLWPYILIGWVFQAQAANASYLVLSALILTGCGVSDKFRIVFVSVIRSIVVFGARFFLFPFKD